MLIHRYQLTVRMTEEAFLPEYKGSMFRGAFGWAFRNSVCVTKAKECTGCLLMSVCSYFRVFETEAPEAHNIPFMNGVKKIPHPYILLPPLERRRKYFQGDQMTVILTLMGETVKMLPFFIYSFQQMGMAGIGFDRKRFRLSSVNLIEPGGRTAELLGEGSGSIDLRESPLDLCNLEESPAPEKVTLKFMTPYRAQVGAVVIKNPEMITPELLINAIRRRYMVVTALYGGGAGDMGVDDLSVKDVTVTDNQLQFSDWDRYSNRQHTKMSMGGMAGSITFEGNLAPVWHLLRIGEYIHIGKNAVFGLGKYEMEKS